MRTRKSDRALYMHREFVDDAICTEKKKEKSIFWKEEGERRRPIEQLYIFPVFSSSFDAYTSTDQNNNIQPFSR